MALKIMVFFTVTSGKYSVRGCTLMVLLYKEYKLRGADKHKGERPDLIHFG